MVRDTIRPIIGVVIWMTMDIDPVVTMDATNKSTSHNKAYARHVSEFSKKCLNAQASNLLDKTNDHVEVAVRSNDNFAAFKLNELVLCFSSDEHPSESNTDRRCKICTNELQTCSMLLLHHPN